MTILQVSFHLSYGFADQASQDIYQRTKDEFYTGERTSMKSTTLVR